MPQDSSMCLKQKPTREESVGVAVTDSFRKYREHIVNTVEFAILLFKYSLLPHNKHSQSTNPVIPKKFCHPIYMFSYFFLFKPDVNDLDMTYDKCLYL